MLLMMGTADELPKEPVQKTVFMEDMTEQQLASAVSTAGMRKFRIDQDFLIEHWHMIYIMSVVFA